MTNYKELHKILGNMVEATLANEVEKVKTLHASFKEISPKLPNLEARSDKYCSYDSCANLCITIITLSLVAEKGKAELLTKFQNLEKP